MQERFDGYGTVAHKTGKASESTLMISCNQLTHTNSTKTHIKQC